MDLGERSEYALFVGTAEWTRDPEAEEDRNDMFVEVKVDGASEAVRTMFAKTARWDDNLK
ncbi:hypothetical protein FIBSPDRAFT_929194, partial [Athelia psychrophila]